MTPARFAPMLAMLAGAAILASSPLSAQSRSDAAAARTAEAALRAAPVFDGHNDVPWQLRQRFENRIVGFDFTDTLDTADPEHNEAAMHTDIRRLRQGRVGAQFWSVYVPASLPEPQAVVTTLEQIDVARRLIEANRDALAFATTADEVEAAIRRGRVASLLGMEGGHSIGSSLAVLRQMHALGVRYMTLTHSANTPWADSATAAPQHDGLTPFGLAIVREMNRLGMLVDLSHVSEATMNDALDVAQAPVIFSHSGALGVNTHPRNVPDSVLARLKTNGGVVMVVGLPAYLDEELRQFGARREGERARLAALHPGNPVRAAAELKQWEAANPAPKATVSDMADHIDHVRRVAGIDHIGIGGDYDGMPSGPVGMEDVAGYPALFTELARRGYSRADLEKISLRNVLRVMRAAEATAARLAATPPAEVTPTTANAGLAASPR